MVEGWVGKGRVGWGGWCRGVGKWLSRGVCGIEWDGVSGGMRRGCVSAGAAVGKLLAGGVVVVMVAVRTNDINDMYWSLVGGDG